MEEKMDLSLRDALVKHDITTVTRLIAEGVNVNCKLKPEDLVDEDMDYVTPLCVAINNFDYPLTKLLLEAGAEPNYPLPLNMGLIEFALGALANIEINWALNKPTKKNMTFFGKELPIQKSLKINHELIDTCNKILDLLLVYGTEPKLKWTDGFSEAMVNLREASSISTENPLSVRNIVSEMGEQCDLRGISGLKKYLAVGVGSVVIIPVIQLLRSRLPIINKNQMRDIVYSIDHIESEVTSALTEIKNDRKKLLHHRRRDLIYTFNLLVEKSKKNDLDNRYTQTFPLELVTHIIQFENDFTKEVADVRTTQKRIINFWKKEEKDIIVTKDTLPSNRI